MVKQNVLQAGWLPGKAQLAPKLCTQEHTVPACPGLLCPSFLIHPGSIGATSADLAVRLPLPSVRPGKYTLPSVRPGKYRLTDHFPFELEAAGRAGSLSSRQKFHPKSGTVLTHTWSSQLNAAQSKPHSEEITEEALKFILLAVRVTPCSGPQ